MNSIAPTLAAALKIHFKKLIGGGVLTLLFFNTAFLSPLLWRGAGGEVFGQSGQKWATDLNPASGTDALGTSNNFPLVIKTNSTERLRVKETGELLLYNVMGYSSDYSALFTPLSLVSKGYVDNAIASAIAGLPPPVVPALANVLIAGRNADAVGSINDNSGNPVMNLNQRKLFNALGNVKVDWEQGYLYNAVPANLISLKWLTRELVGYDGLTSSLNWGGRITFDEAGALSMSWDTRDLFNGGGTRTLNWQNRTLNSGIWNYDADYSAGYTPRSLVDMEYVDTRIKNAITPSFWSAGAGTAAVMNDQGGGNNAGGNYSLIGAGQNNLIEPNAPFGVILGGTGNTIFNAAGPSNNHDYNLMGVGQGNTIQSTASHAIVLGGTNNSAAGLHSTVIGGIGNTGSGTHSFIGAGTGNSIAANAPYGAILSGAGNSIQNFLANISSFNFISSGQSNTIQHDANYSSIIGGSNNTIQSGANNSVILGGSNITATQSNTVYVPNLVNSGNITVNGKITTSRITSADSIFHIGDSSITFQTSSTTNRIFANLGLGLGFATSARGSGSLAIGRTVTVPNNIDNAIVIGTGIIPSNTQFVNNQANSLMIGFNSTLPTVFVSPANPAGTTGNVGVGGITNPSAKLEIKGATNSQNASSFKITNNAGAQSLIVNDDGSIVIGAISPYKTLTVAGDVSFVNTNNSTLNSFEILGNSGIPARRGISLDNDPNGSMNFYVHSYQTPSSFNFLDGNGNANIMTIDAKAKAVGIGTTNVGSGYKLYVNGNIRAKELKVEPNWSDFVFEKDYKLMSLEEVDAYIKKYGHLPDVPDAKEVEKNGIDVGQMNALLLQKIEELTLYMIEIKKENQNLKTEINNLKTQ